MRTVELLAEPLVLFPRFRILSLAAEELRRDDDPLHAGGRLERRVLHVAGLFAEDRLQELLLGGRFGLALRRDLADENIAFDDVRSHADDAVFVQILDGIFADVRNLARQLFLAALGVADLELELFDVERAEDIFRYHPLVDDDGVLEIIPAPGHEGDENIPAEGEFALIGRASVGENIALLDPLSRLDDCAHVDRGVLVRAEELDQGIFHAFLLFKTDQRLDARFIDVVADDDDVGIDKFDPSVAFRDSHGACIAGDLLFKTGADDRRFRAKERYRLALHVRTHQRAVGVVVLEKRYEGRSGAGDLVRSHIRVLDFFRLRERIIALETRLDALGEEFSLRIDRGIRLRDRVNVFLLRGHVLDLIGHPAVLHLAVRRLDETEFVDVRMDAERRDKTDVRAFGRFDRTEPAVMRVVHVADFESGALAGQTARAKGRHAALVRNLGERVGLVHELRQLVGAEERIDHARDRPRVHQVLGGYFFLVAEAEPLPDRARHAGEPDIDLLADLLSNCPNAAISKMIDVVDRLLPLLEVDQIIDDRDDVVLRERQIGRA